MTLIGAVAVCSFLPAPIGAAEPQAAAGARHLADSIGGSPNDFELLHEGSAQVEFAETSLWAGKYLDHRTGAVHIVYTDANGAIAGDGLRHERAEAAADALSAMERKADAELRAAIAATEGRVSAADPGATVPVGIWLNIDPSAAVQEVIERHGELQWEGDQPLVDDLATARAIRSELAAARAGARGPAIEALRANVDRLGGTIGYVSTTAPLVYVDMPPTAVAAVAELPSVASLGLERTWTPTMTSAGPAVQADWTPGTEDLGSGVRVAVVEYHNVRPVGDLAGKVVAVASPTGASFYTPSGTFDHPTWVAGAIAGGGNFRGVAPGALIVSSSTGGGAASVTRDRQIIAAADWSANATGGDADVINTSIGQDTPTGSEEARRYFDALADDGGRLTVAAAGNLVTFGNWNVVSPGTSYNTLTVGGIDDRGSADRNDDQVWFTATNGSNYIDLRGTSWNANGDYNKPNVSAPAVSVRTANGLSASGTSIASPIVAGIAAQIIARVPSLALRPEASRAIIMASAIHHSAMPGGGISADHEGTGTASALWANRLLTAGDGTWGGFRMGAMSAGQTIAQDITVKAGQKVKVVVSWNSDSRFDLSADQLLADLDLRVTLPNGTTSGSFTFDNNYEWVEFTSPTAGTAHIEVRQARFNGTSERYGLAWAKWGVGTPTRIAGATRYETAAAISRAHFNPSVPVAYVATGANFPDALAAGPAAGIGGGPVLLTEANALPAATAGELVRLHPGRIVVVGGPNVVSDSVVLALQAYGSVVRLSGADRYGTAAAISRATFSPGVPAVFVATGKAFPDALTAGPAAVRNRGPVLLTDAASVPPATAAELAYLKPQRIYVVGGPAVVSDAVVAALRAYGPVSRLFGPDRYRTAVAVSSHFFDHPVSAYIATGANFPDALATVPGAGRFGSPLLLTGRTTLATPTAAELIRLEPPLTYFVGGPAAIADAVVSQTRALLAKQ